jgi:hypothetical protein
MKIESILRLENDQEGNTWYSNNDHPQEGELQIHMARDLYLAMGKPTKLKIEIHPTSYDR